MSDTGIYSTIYRQLRQHAEFIDRTLIDFQTNNKLELEVKRRLISILDGLINESLGLAFRYLKTILLAEASIKIKDIEKCKVNLENDTFSLEDFQVLDQLAILLRKQEDAAMKKMERRLR